MIFRRVRVIELSISLLLSWTAFAAPEDIIILGNRSKLTEESCNKPLFDGYRARGWKGRLRIVSENDLTRQDLLGAKMVIVEQCGQNAALDSHQRELLKALVGYARAGGGLVVCQSSDQMLNYMTFREELMRALGGRVLYEAPQVPKERWVMFGETDELALAETDRVFPPLNDGVRRVLFQPRAVFRNYVGALAFLPNDDWKVALTAGRDVPGFVGPETGFPPIDENRRAKSFDGDVPVVGCRDFGKGRAVWCGFLFEPFVSDTQEPMLADRMDRLLVRGIKDGEPSDTGRFLYNAMDWVSAHVGELEAAQVPALETLAAYEKRLGTDLRFFRGVVGPRTTFSSGKSTAAEYVTKAKALGHDFIVFLEDFAHLTPANYEKLRAECAAFTDEKFTVLAGYTYEDDCGNRQYAFSTGPLYPGRKYLTPDGRRFLRNVPNGGSVGLAFFYSALGFCNQRGWYSFADSPYAETDMRNVQSMGYVTRINGVTAETADRVWKINARDGQQVTPYALELMDEARYLTEESWTSVIGRPGVLKLREFFSDFDSHNEYPRAGCFGRISTSSGPIVDFSLARSDMGTDARLLYDPVLDRAAYTLSVMADRGLDTVEVWDGDTRIRRWKANGEKSFLRTGAFTNERQHYFWVKATDAKGGVAVTRPSNTESFLLRETMCNDRNNQLLYSSQPRKDPKEPPFFSSYGADTCIPDKGPWNGRVRPVGFFVFDKKYGIGGWGGSDGSPEGHPQVKFFPSLWAGGQEAKSLGWVQEFVAGLEGGPHVRPERVVSSSNALVGDRVLDGVFPLSERNVVHVWWTLLPVQPSAYAATTARCSLFLPKPDGTVAYQWEQTLTLKAPVPTKAGERFVRFGHMGKSKSTTGVTACLGGMVVSNAMDRTFEMKAGDFIFVEDPKFGSLGVFALAPIIYRAASFFVYGDGNVAPAGASYPFRMAMVGFHRLTPRPFEAARQFVAAYGLDGNAPAYAAKLASGTAHPNGVCLDAIADKGVLAGRLDGVAKLPGTLGLRLAGLDDRRVAVVACPAGVRIVPVEKGTAYVALRNEESDCELFVGHPFVCDNPELVLALSRTAKGGWSLEVHNPTDGPIAAKVAADPRCGAFSFARDVRLTAGASVDFEL